MLGLDWQPIQHPVDQYLFRVRTTAATKFATAIDVLMYTCNLMTCSRVVVNNDLGTHSFGAYVGPSWSVIDYPFVKFAAAHSFPDLMLSKQLS